MKQSSDFQIKVWQEIEKIPYGEMAARTYKDIAIAIGKPNAHRAKSCKCMCFKT